MREYIKKDNIEEAVCKALSIKYAQYLTYQEIRILKIIYAMPSEDVVPLDKVINVSLYDEEHEEWSNKAMTVRDYLYMYTDFEEEK